MQAVRFDDNTTTYRTEWKAIAVNSDYTNVLLYNLTADISESVPLSGTPVGPDSTVSLFSRHNLCMAGVADSICHLKHEEEFLRTRMWVVLICDSLWPQVRLDHPARGSPEVEKAVAHAIELFRSEHVENPYWKSSQNATDKCCNSCFSPTGCSPAQGCKFIGPAPPPPLPPSPSPPGKPVLTSEMVGNWTATDGDGHVIFTVEIDSSSEVTITNPADATSCWKSGVGRWDASKNLLEHVVCTGCSRNATGTVRRRVIHTTIDVDYPYQGESLEITWDVISGPDDADETRRWPVWTKVVKELSIVYP